MEGTYRMGGNQTFRTGGASEVFLVRNSARIEERKKQLAKLMELAGQGFNDVRAQQFTEVIKS